MNKKKTKLAQMNAGKSLRILMSENDITSKKLAEDMRVTEVTISSLRKKKLISGKNLVALSDYFGLSAADFIRKGEE